MIVKTSRAMQVMVDTIASCWKSNEVTMIVDLEGENLGDTDGTTDLLSIYHIPTKHAFIVQLAVLGRRAFDITASGGWTLGSLLEDPNTLKGLWDVRNDAAGLYRCYRIKLRGVLDVQLMWCKVKHMTEDKRRRLEVAMVDFINMTAEDEAAFQSTEERGRLLWNPDRGGDFSVFQEEELQQTIILYCLADVVLLAEIMEGLWKYLTKESMATVRDKSREACNKSFSETYYSGWTPRKVANPFYKAGNMRRERLRLEDDIEELRRKNNRSRQEVEVAAGLW
jgi:exonuclease 3'-5' domain-containing protein 1